MVLGNVTKALGVASCIAVPLAGVTEAPHTHVRTLVKNRMNDFGSNFIPEEETPLHDEADENTTSTTHQFDIMNPNDAIFGNNSYVNFGDNIAIDPNMEFKHVFEFGTKDADAEEIEDLSFDFEAEPETELKDEPTVEEDEPTIEISNILPPSADTVPVPLFEKDEAPVYRHVLTLKKPHPVSDKNKALVVIPQPVEAHPFVKPQRDNICPVFHGCDCTNSDSYDDINNNGLVVYQEPEVEQVKPIIVKGLDREVFDRYGAPISMGKEMVVYEGPEPENDDNDDNVEIVENVERLDRAMVEYVKPAVDDSVDKALVVCDTGASAKERVYKKIISSVASALKAMKFFIVKKFFM